MIIDAHVYCGQSIMGYGASAEEILRQCDALSIDKAVLIPVKPRSYHLGPENTFIARTVQDHPDRFTGFARVDPRLGGEAESEMKRSIQELCLKGLYLNPWEETFQINESFVWPLMEKAQTFKVPVMIKGGHPVVSQPSQIADLAKRFPKTIIIATSGGQINICGGGLQDAMIMLEENKNVYMETSGIYREDFIEEMARKIGAKRLIFGSGSPVFDARFELQRVTRAHLGKADKNKIAGLTIKNLLSL
ncbi:MAG: amidohydrolase family protein [Vulcanimicrobiota bacterium]